MTRYLVLRSGAAMLCGVEAFSRKLAQQLGHRGRSQELNFDLASLSRSLDSCDAIVMNFPIVAWKKRLAEPLVAAVIARLKGKRVTVVLHEWASLDWKRRLTLWPVTRLADAIVFSSPEIRDEWKQSRWSAYGKTSLGIVPIPPNLAPAEGLSVGPAASAIREHRRAGRIIIGQFGSIYPKKNSVELLAIARELMNAGHDVFVVFVGSFIKAMDNVEDDFKRAVEQQDLGDRVLVTGYIGTDEEVFSAFREIDVFCYRFAEGLTSRRGSVLAAALSGRRVVVNAPQHPDALAHHSLFQALVDNGNIVVCPAGADIGAMARAVGLAIDSGAPPALDFDREIARLWDNNVAELDRVQQAG
jgi:glycosyltransferase involved in cell wall biosynthesis